MLFLYHAGSGGEFIAKTFSAHHSEYGALNYRETVDRNQTHSISPIMYSSQWPDQNDPTTWINPHYDVNPDDKGFIIKDHPTSYNLELYNKHIPNLVTVYLHAETQQEYFARLAFAKLGKRITAPIPSLFIRSKVNDLLTPEQEHAIIVWSGKYEWIWEHEAMICNTKLANGENLNDFHHQSSLDKYIADHTAQDKMWQDTYDSIDDPCFVRVNIDSLVSSSADFWHEMNETFPGIDEIGCQVDTNAWINQNNRLLEI